MNRRFRLSIAVVAIIIAVSVAAQQPPNQEKGFVPDRMFHFSDLDHINTFNGNLVITIPIGPRYPVGGSLSYGASLVYNSNPWELIDDVSGNLAFTYAIPNRRSNAGLGWLVTFGRLIAPTCLSNKSGTWLYESSDGADHVLYPAGGFQIGQNLATMTLLSADSSYLRLGPTVTSERVLEFPDGTIQIFHNYDTGTSCGNWRLRAIQDRFGNHIDFAYAYNTADGFAEIWTITDSGASATARTEKLYFASTASQVVLDHIDMPGTTGTLTYSFSYAIQTVQVPEGDTLNYNYITGEPATTQVLQLVGVAMPESQSYAMMSGASVPYYNATRPGSGLINRLRLPTFGSIAWEYGLILYPNSDGDPIGFKSRLPPRRRASLGIARRKTLDAVGNPISETIYKTFLSTGDTCNGALAASNPPRQFTSVVLRGDGMAALSYFSVDDITDLCNPSLWDPDEYGLPFTRYVADSSNSAGTPRFLNTEVRQFSASDIADFTTRGHNGPLGRFNLGTLLSSQYVQIERDATIPGSTGFDRNQRETWRRSVRDRDTSCGVACYTEIAHSNYDGFGHFRRSSTGGNYVGGNFSTTFTNYQGVGPSDEWVLNTYSEKCTRDESSFNSGTVSACSDLGSSAALTTFCFDRATGFLKGRRVFANGVTAGSTDVVTLYTPNSHGNVQSEDWYGGDQGVAIPSSLCTAPSSQGTYHIDYTYSYGILATATYAGQPFKSTDQTVDVTGSITSDRDLAGNETTYEYDGLLRLKTVIPSDSAKTTYDYSVPTATVPELVTVSRVDRDTAATVLAQQAYRYDAIGRLVDEMRKLPDSNDSLVTWSTRHTVYDDLQAAQGASTPVEDRRGTGRRLKVSEFELPADGTRPIGYTVFSYDAFDRVTNVTMPDGATMSTQYVNDGNSTIVETRNVAMSAVSGAAETPVNKTTVLDAAGRIASVTEPSGANGADVVTTYTYDVGGRLSNVSMADGAVTQTRAFSYDHRGFLLSELHPEKGPSGAGYVLYPCYDPKGHSLRRIDALAPASGGVAPSYNCSSATASGAYDTTYEYDAAERLTAMKERLSGSTTREIKRFTFGTSNATGDKRLGKLTSAKRHNYVSPASSAVDMIVEEAYVYGGPDGRVSKRTTSVERSSTDKPTFEQTFEYTPLGLVDHVHYPDCTSQCGSSRPRAVAYGYTNGVVTSISGYTKTLTAPAMPITYWPNGLMKTAVHANDVTDSQVSDVVARPKSIAFSNWLPSAPVAACQAPTLSGPSGTLINSNSSTTLTVSASVPSGTLSYQWYEGASGSQLTPIAGATSASYLTGTLTEAKSYWVRVTNTCTSSTAASDSPTATVSIRAALPSPVLSVSIGGDGFVLLSWTPVSGAASYQVLRSRGGAALSNLYTVYDVTVQKDAVISPWESAVYAVVAKAPDKSDSPASNAVLITRAPFTNATLSLRAVKGIDIGELRRAIDAVRFAGGWAPLWTSYAAPTGFVSATDVQQMRTALSDARTRINQLFGVPTVALGETASSGPPAAVIKAIHLENLRSALR